MWFIRPVWRCVMCVCWGGGGGAGLALMHYETEGGGVADHSMTMEPQKPKAKRIFRPSPLVDLFPGLFPLATWGSALQWSARVGCSCFPGCALSVTLGLEQGPGCFPHRLCGGSEPVGLRWGVVISGKDTA